MRELKKNLLVLSILFSAFTIVSCGSPLSSLLHQPVTVSFSDAGTVFYEVELLYNTTIDSNNKPNNPTKSGNYFLYWSESTANQASAVEFNFDAPITSNKTLYAIYTPTLYSIENVSTTQIEIKLGNKQVYPLDDGSYAGLKFQYSSDGENYQDLNLSVPAYTKDEGAYRYLTYSLPASLNLSASTYTFKVTNGTNTKTKTLNTSSASAVTIMNTKVSEGYASVKFRANSNGYSYTVKAYKNNTEVASKTIPVNLYADGIVEFYGLENDTQYILKITTDGTDEWAQTVVNTPALTKKTSDWLVIMYMDGDNNLHQPIYMDMNEVEYGLNNIRNSDDTAKSGYDSVNVVALWDGTVSYLTYDNDGNTISAAPQIGEAGTYILELGTDSSNTKTITGGGCVLSENTKNLSHTASWLVGSNKGITTEAQYGEANMGDKQTLIDFLTWVKTHYTVNKGIILQFSNHGGGPRSIKYIETADGRTIKVGDTSGRRALCWDDSSNSAFLKTKDVSDALSATGFGTNKLDMIIMDVCLGSSLEDAYQFKDYAKYLAASPNTVPGNGLDYVAFMKSFKENTSTEDLGKQLVVDYKAQYGKDSTNYDSYWDYYASSFSNSASSWDDLNSNQQNALEWFGDFGIPTFTFTDLSKIDDVQAALDNLCELLLTNKTKKIYIDDKGYISPTVTDTTENLITYLGQRHANIVNLFTDTGTTAYYINDTMYYMGSFTWLYDIGYFADMVRVVTNSTFSGSQNENAWSELYSAATTLTEKLDAAIVSSWRDSKLDSYGDLYHKIDGNTASTAHHYGLSICGANVATNGNNFTMGTAPSFYKADLAFGQNSKWGDLLEYWFGTR